MHTKPLSGIHQRGDSLYVYDHYNIKQVDVYMVFAPIQVHISQENVWGLNGCTCQRNECAASKVFDGISNIRRAPLRP